MEETPFGRYLLIEQLGQGGMGEVWRAHDTKIDRLVAIKMLLPHFARDPKFEKRFRREARAAARLDDPHVVAIYDFGEIEGRLYVSMRLIDGQDLQTLLDDGPVEPQRAVAIIAQVAQALQAAHKVGLVHRDIKPSNILVAEHDFAYLIDFGIARAAGETGLTSTGATIGTWSYMSPERFSTGVAEASSDIYSLGCVLYQCLTGRLPFPAVALEQIAVAHMTTPPPRPSTQQPGIPASMDRVIATALAKHPAQRHATATALAAAAQAALIVPIRRAPPTAPPPRAPEPAAPGRISRSEPPPQLVAAPLSGTRPPSPPRSLTLAPRQTPTGRLPPTAPPVGPPRLPPPVARPRRGGKAALGATTVLAAATMVVAAILLIPDHDTTVTTPGPRSSSPATSTPRPVSYGAQVVLPFTGLTNTSGLAVDTAGAVYVTDDVKGRVLKLSVGSAGPVELPFTGLNHPCGLAVDGAGAVYVADNANKRVLKLLAGATTPVALPLSSLDQPNKVAVDGTGAVYVSDSKNNRVLKLAGGSTTPVVLPFTGLSYPVGVALDAAGTVYVVDGNNKRVLKLPAGSTAADVLSFSGPAYPADPFDPYDVAVDSSGAVYVADYNNRRVLKKPAGSATPTVLPFDPTIYPLGVTVDSAGTVYLADRTEVRKLPVQ